MYADTKVNPPSKPHENEHNPREGQTILGWAKSMVYHSFNRPVWCIVLQGSRPQPAHLHPDSIILPCLTLVESTPWLKAWTNKAFDKKCSSLEERDAVSFEGLNAGSWANYVWKNNQNMRFHSIPVMRIAAARKVDT